MKAKFLGGTLAAAMLILLPLRAEEPAAAGPRAERLSRFDTNQDGRLDRAERRAARAARDEERRTADERREELKARRQAYDRDGDGRLNDEEFAAFDAANRAALEQRPRALRRFDTDRDGRLNDDEWARARAELRDRLQERERG